MLRQDTPLLAAGRFIVLFRLIFSSPSAILPNTHGLIFATRIFIASLVRIIHCILDAAGASLAGEGSWQKKEKTRR
jgi:hypothetical protein